MNRPSVLSMSLAAAGHDVTADQLAALHESVIVPEITSRGGAVAGAGGDSLVAEFADSAAAIETARRLQHLEGGITTAAGIDAPEEPGSIDLAVTLSDLAGAGEIYVSDTAAEDAGADTESIGVHPLHGRNVEVYRLPNGKSGTGKKAAFAAIPLASLGLLRLKTVGRSELAEDDAAPLGESCDICNVLHLDIPSATEEGATVLVEEVVDDGPPTFDVIGGSDEQRELADYAQEKFAEYGLDLPDVTITFHEETRESQEANCGGHVAVAGHGADETTIEMCGTTSSTLMHEMAHAWANQELTEEDKAAFLELRGLENWTDDPIWGFRGSEHAANVIAWGMQEDPVRPSGTTPNDDESLAEAFRLLTGQEPVSMRDDLDDTEIVAALDEVEEADSDDDAVGWAAVDVGTDAPLDTGAEEDVAAWAPEEEPDDAWQPEEDDGSPLDGPQDDLDDRESLLFD